MSEQTAAIPREARNWAMGAHMIALVGLLGNGLGFLVGPLILWLLKRDAHPFINEQGKEAVNFQITMLGAILVCIPLLFVGIGILLMPLIGLYDVVMTIIAGIKAADGTHWRYPLTMRLIA
ncbi:MAG TPA: DUF4870 domain-containing protein [Candidatus Polarisedimenticolaceae bacterium]|nr:DUF4870 domain-containing protein [Candidatus Polarisedimenticolaceae bacterium]